MLLETRHRGDLGRGVAAALLDRADGTAGLVALALELLDLDERRPPLRVQAQPGLRQGGIDPAARQPLDDALRVVAHEVPGQHGRAVYLARLRGAMRRLVRRVRRP